MPRYRNRTSGVVVSRREGAARLPDGWEVVEPPRPRKKSRGSSSK